MTEIKEATEVSSTVVPKSFLDRFVGAITINLAQTLVNIPWITPNRISFFSAIVGGFLASWLIVIHEYLIAVLLIVIAGICDSLDGDLARARGAASREGEIIDSVLDRYVDFLLISALILAAPQEDLYEYLIVGLLALLGSTLVPYIRARSEAAGKSTVASIGSRATRTVLILFGLLTQQLFPLLIVLAAISNIAAIHRFVVAVRI
jgi:phosphatidylglycerophosphate synthase